MLRQMLLIACLAAAGAVPARAQIFSWRDANGTLVLSDRPVRQAGRGYDVGGRAPVQAAGQASRPKGDTGYRVAQPTARGYDGSLDALIARHAATYRLSPDLVRAVIQVESGFDPRAQSPKGARGLMQLMPATAAEMGVGNVFDPEENIRGGSAYLRQLLDRYGDDVTLALAAYNAGPDAVERHGRQVPPFPETRAYVSRVTGRTAKGPIVVAPPKPRARIVYKVIEMIDGRPVPRYTDTKPESGPYEIVSRREPES